MAELRPELAVDGLGQRQLSNVVLASACRAASTRELEAPQPFQRHDVILVADARLDNACELAETLVGRSTPTCPDVELIARSYERWGANAAEHLEGDFAYVLWDAMQQRVLACRDGMGVRPLFFLEHAGTFWFASEVEQLLLVPGLPLDLDEGGVLDYLTWERHELDGTMFRDIRRVRPAHQLIATQAGSHQVRYWDPRSEIGRAVHLAPHSAFRSALECAVATRLRSTRPAVIHLSGGLDSSSIACIADRLCAAGRGPAAGAVTASAVYPGLDCDETSYIDAVAASLLVLRGERWNGNDHDWSDLDDPAPAWPGEKVIGAGHSTGDLAIIRKHGARTLLSGEGGDEVCSDGRVLDDLARSGDWIAVLQETLLARARPLRWSVRRLLGVVSELSPCWARSLLHRRHPEALPPHWLTRRLRERWRGRHDAMRGRAAPHCAAEAVADYLGSGLCGHVIEAEQRYSSWAGAETRFPFLSRQVIRIALSLSLDQRRPRGRYRGFQRAAMAGLLPVEVMRRPPVTYEAALIRTGHDALHRLRAILSTGGPWLCRPYVSLREARALLDRADGWQDWSALLRLASLESWLRRHHDVRG